MNYPELVEQLVQNQVLRTPAIIAAFREVRRELFLPDSEVQFAGANQPLPIGFGQTNSQPFTVAFMLELLQPQPGQNVLDVGCGSGWTTALLAHVVGAGGHVTGCDRIEQLATTARANLESLGCNNAEINHTPTQLGYPLRAPFARVLVSAAAEKLPDTLLRQLELGGSMVIPVNHSIYHYLKTASGIESTEYPGFSFVPLIE